MRNIFESNPNNPTFVFDDLPLHWQMTRPEKFAFASLVDKVKPKVAIEIGTFKGGSLQLLSRVAQKVYSIDISPQCPEKLGNLFNNVEFWVGDSKKVLPELLKKIQDNNELLEFVLTDGGHSTRGVQSDINILLKYIPSRPIYIVFHDSFYPACRKGILRADWHSCPYVHYVEIDFIPGVYHRKPFDTAKSRSMFGGLALGLMLPESRNHQLVINQSQRGLYNTIFHHSRHGIKRYFFYGFYKNNIMKLIVKLYQKVKQGKSIKRDQ